MKAWLWDGTELSQRSLPNPTPESDQVVLEVLAAGICRSDLTVMDRGTTGATFDLPIVLGHEAVGRVIEVGPEADPILIGTDVAVYGPRGCTVCRSCRLGTPQYCSTALRRGLMPIGLGIDGALAERMLVPSVRDVLPLKGVPPTEAAPLTDAGLTAYSAIQLVAPMLSDGTRVLVVGAGGGLGHLAVQWLKRYSDICLVAMEAGSYGRALLYRLGIQQVVAGLNEIPDVFGKEGCKSFDIVFDFVGSQETVDIGSVLLARNGNLIIVGVGGGRVPVGVGSVAYGATIRTPYWGSPNELAAVLDDAQRGHIQAEVTLYDFDEVPQVYRDLREGNVSGRAVVVPSRL